MTDDEKKRVAELLVDLDSLPEIPEDPSLNEVSLCAINVVENSFKHQTLLVIMTLLMFNVNVNVKNIYRRRRMSRVRIGGASGRRNVRLSRMQQQTVLFSDVP